MNDTVAEEHVCSLYYEPKLNTWHCEGCKAFMYDEEFHGIKKANNEEDAFGSTSLPQIRS